MTVINYDWDELEDNIVEEYDDAGTTVAEYTTEPDQFGNLVSQRRSSQDSYYHYDGQGSTLAVTDVSGNVSDTRSYSAFGETVEHAGSTVLPFQYMGQNGSYRDIETEEYSVRRRVFVPRSARWVSEDLFLRAAQNASNEFGSISSIITVSNEYIYAHNSPLNYVDAFGLTPQRSVVRYTAKLTSPEPFLAFPLLFPKCKSCLKFKLDILEPTVVIKSSILSIGDCPADVLLGVGIKERIDEKIKNLTLDYNVGCGDLVCHPLISFQQELSPLVFPILDSFCWKGLLRAPCPQNQKEKKEKRIRGLCTVFALVELPVKALIEIGYCS